MTAPETDVPLETLARWRFEWQFVGTARIAELLASPAVHLLIYDPSMPGDVKRREAERWLKERSAELNRQAEQATADRRWARWHSWINTTIAMGALLVAIVSLWRSQ